MYSQTLWFKLLLALIQAGLIVNPHNVEANFSDSFTCVNSTMSSSCIHTYEQLYNSLAKSDNSFNIESALYPAMRPSSVLVRVSINYFPTNSTRYSESKYAKHQYLWSISCLYAAVPAMLLQISSLGSILVAPRTQDLTIRIPRFCCNVSDKDSGRKEIIKGMIKGVLAALQDLAVSPAIRDPRLNTAECVIEGHKTDISATGSIRNIFITIISWSSVGFTFVSCYLLANIFEKIRQKAENQNGQEKFFALAICTLCSLLAVIGVLILLAALGISIFYCSKGELRWDFPVSIGVIFIGSISVFSWRKIYLNNEKWCSVRFTICASVSSYLASWLLIGIMINPTWGLTVTLLLVFFLAAFTFAMYQYLSASENHPQVACSCVFFVFAVIFLVVQVVVAGQAYYGRETADETLKTALLSAIGAVLSWLSWKKHFRLEPPNNQAANQQSNNQPANQQPNIQPANQSNDDIEMGQRQPLVSN